MVSSCVVVGCTNRWGGSVSFHRIPIQPERRKLWLASLNRKDWTPNKQDRVCGAHFTSGCVSHNKDDPDYVPTVNMGYDPSRPCTPLVKKPAKYHTNTTVSKLIKRQRMEERNKQSAASVLLNFSNITPLDSHVENSPTQGNAVDRKATKDGIAVPNQGNCSKEIKKEDIHNPGTPPRPLLPKAAVPSMFSLTQSSTSNLPRNVQVNNNVLVNNNGTPSIPLLQNVVPSMFSLTQTSCSNPPGNVQVSNNGTPSIPLLANAVPSMFSLTQGPSSNPPIKVQVNSDGTSSKRLLPKPVPSTFLMTPTSTSYFPRNVQVNNNVLVNNKGTPSIPLLPSAVPSMFSLTQTSTSNPPRKVQVNSDGTSSKPLLPKPVPSTFFVTQTSINNPPRNVQVNNNVPVTASEAVPSVFVIPMQTAAITRKGATKIGKGSDSDTASENDERLHVATQTDIPNVCSHQFSLQTMIQSKPNMKLLPFYTGFSSLHAFYCVLQSLVPDKDRSCIVYWDRHKGNQLTSDDECFDSDTESGNSGSDDDDETIQPFGSDKISLEDEFLLTMMKLKLGLLNKDLAVRFCIPMSTVTNIFNTWVNLLYVVLGSIKIFPHRDIVINHMSHEFQKQFPDVMIILHCEELSIEMSTSSERKSDTHSDYTSTNACAFKGLVGVDSRGGIMFVSNLYPGDLSNRDIFHRSGLFNLLKLKLENGELKQNDVIMADESFAIAEELSELGLRSTVPLVLGKRKRLSDDDVKDSYVTTQPNIGVERAMRKVRDFHIFRSKLPKQSAGVVNQIWTACCLLVNFQDPVITLPGESD